MKEEQGTLRERNEAKRLENEAARLKSGFVRGTLLPAVTWTVAVVMCAAALRHFCITGTIFDTTRPPVDRDIYYDALRSYNDGDLEMAETQISKVVAKVPTHAPANQLLARLALARGDRIKAVVYLKRALQSSLNREEVTQWIAGLEAPR